MKETFFNPFSDIKVETATGPRLLARHSGVVHLESPKNWLLIGSRGSGKTSALLCLDWAERARNVPLRKEIGTEGVSFISVYSKLHHHISSAIATIPWRNQITPEASEEVAFEYFSLLIELLAAELLIGAVIDMRAEGLLKYQFPDEKRAAEAIYRKVRESHLSSPDRPFIDLASCGQWCREYRLEVHKAGSRHFLQEALDCLPETRPGRFLQNVADELAAFLKSPACDHQLPADFHFKICFDEAETLSPSQQLYLNTLVRHSETPLFWVIATVDRGYETTGVRARSQSLTSTDRQVIFLDQDEDNSKTFSDFAEKVVTLRIRSALGCYDSLTPTPYDEVEVSFQRFLEHFNINTAISRLIENSNSQYSQQLREWADQYEREIVSPSKNDGKRGSRARGRGRKRLGRHFYETYLVKKLFPEKSFSEIIPAGRIERENVMSGLRRKQYGALLCIVREGRFGHVPYYGAESLLNMADANIRELLEIIEFLFDAALRQFSVNALLVFAGIELRETIKWKAQRNAFYDASQSKLNGITNRHAEVGGSVSTLIKVLGLLTFALQTDTENLKALRTPERGNFEIDLDGLQAIGLYDKNAVIERTREVLDRCIEDSLLKETGLGLKTAKTIGRSRSVYEVRLHQRFAPVFKTSIRGAYATQRIPARYIAEICVSPGDTPAELWAERLYQMLKHQQSDARQPEFEWERIEEGGGDASGGLSSDE